MAGVVSWGVSAVVVSGVVASDACVVSVGCLPLLQLPNKMHTASKKTIKILYLVFKAIPSLKK